jgi:CRISPR-associated protein Cas8a1/Csx13
MAAESKQVVAVPKELTWSLADPGMSLLERAGLAALYMTLQAASELDADLSPLSWNDDDLTDESVTVRWESTAQEAFTKLFAWAWQVKGGVLHFPAIHQECPEIWQRTTTHNGVFRTFLQHTNVQPKGELLTKIVQQDEDRSFAVRYQEPIIRLSKKKKTATKKKAAASGPPKLLKPCKDIETFFDRHGELLSSVSLSSWAFPGIAPRYGKEGAWEGPAKIGILLMLAPIAVLYQQLQGGNWLFVIPDVLDLDDFAVVRPGLNLSAEFADVASLGDAAMQFLAHYSTRTSRKDTCAGCRVVAMGKVGFYSSQSIRKGVLDVPHKAVSVRRYRFLHQVMDNQFIYFKHENETTEDVESPKGGRTKKKVAKKKKAEPAEPQGTGFYKIPTARGRIADNLVEGKRWYADLFQPTSWDMPDLERQRKRQPGKSIERLWFSNLCYQRRNLMKLIEEPDLWDDPNERVFVEAFWEILASLYKREKDAVERGGSRSWQARCEDLNEDIRRSVTRAKTGPLLRECLADLISRPVEKYRSKTVRENPGLIWRLIDRDWKRGRDLALLALASYQSKEKRGGGSTSDAHETNN